MFDKTLLLCGLLVPTCFAGLQVPLAIINLSPYPTEVDLNHPSNCIKGEFNPSALDTYYNSWTISDLIGAFGSDTVSEDMNSFLQTWKGIFGIHNLGTRRHNMYSGVVTLPAAGVNETTPFGVFETEVAGSGECFGSTSWKKFTVTTNGITTSLQLKDPPTANWEIIKNPDTNEAVVIDIGFGGKANALRVTIDAVFGAITIGLTFFGLTKLGLAARAGALALSAATPAFYASTVLIPGIKALALIGGVSVAVGAAGKSLYLR